MSTERPQPKWILMKYIDDRSYDRVMSGTYGQCEGYRRFLVAQWPKLYVTEDLEIWNEKKYGFLKAGFLGPTGFGEGVYEY